jgi:multiple sugar transport system ATP-binding protein
MATLTIQNVIKTFPGGIRAVDDVSLDVAEGERMVLAGPSGCGKTTLLRLIAGLERPDSGKISIDGRIVNNLPPQKRDVALVFQNHTLYPHLNVRGNLAFALKLRRQSKAEINNRIAHTTDMLGIADLLTRKPWELSGGQKQRVALGRAIVRRPKIFLLDEPLSHLDAGLSEQLRREIVRLQQHLCTTMLYVTHDQTEAMTVGRRIVVLRNGQVQQMADPDTLYRRPANRFVATFIGSPAMNFFPGRIENGPDGLIFQSIHIKSPSPLSPLPLGEGQGEGFADVGCVQRTKSQDSENLFSWPVANQWKSALQPYRDKEIVLGVRPEHFQLEQNSSGEGCLKIPAIVESIESLGADSLLHLRAGSIDFVCRTQSRHSASVGDSVVSIAGADHLYFFDPRTEEAIGCRLETAGSVKHG